MVYRTIDVAERYSPNRRKRQRQRSRQRCTGGCVPSKSVPASAVSKQSTLLFQVAIVVNILLSSTAATTTSASFIFGSNNNNPRQRQWGTPRIIDGYHTSTTTRTHQPLLVSLLDDISVSRGLNWLYRRGCSRNGMNHPKRKTFWLMSSPEEHDDEATVRRRQQPIFESVGNTLQTDEVLVWKQFQNLQEIQSYYQRKYAVDDTKESDQSNRLFMLPSVAPVALKRITQLFLAERPNLHPLAPTCDAIKGTTTASDCDINGSSPQYYIHGHVLPNIIQSIVIALSSGEESEVSSSLPPHSPRHQLTMNETADCLCSFSVLLSTCTTNDSYGGRYSDTLPPIQLLLWGRLEDFWVASSFAATVVATPASSIQSPSLNNGFQRSSSMDSPLQLSPKRLVSCLRSVHLYSDATTSALFVAICQRLCQGDAMSRLDAKELVLLLRIVHATTSQHIANNNSIPSTLMTTFQHVIVRVARRLRKESVRNQASVISILHALVEAKRYFHNNNNPKGDLIQALLPNTTSTESLRNELRVMTYTLTKHVVDNCLPIESNHAINMTDRNTSTISSISGPYYCITVEYGAVLCDIIRTVLQLEQTDPLVDRLCHCIVAQAIHSSSPVTILDMTRILSTLEHWQCRHDGISKLVFAFGQSLETHVLREVDRNGRMERERHLRPQDINTILRCAAMLQSRCDDDDDESVRVLKPYWTSAQHLWSHRPFLHRCTAPELSNFCWLAAFKSSGYFTTRDIVVTELGLRTLDQDIVDSCTPKQACRMLSAFTALCTVDDRHRALLAELFGCLGEHLLTTKLSPLDATSAINAYAKASYMADMGIFDHLVDVVTRQVSECTLRQCAQTLWACGKMIAYETYTAVDVDNVPTAPTYQPSYVSGALALTRYISQRSGELATKDVAQTLWAMARLQFDNPDLTIPLVQRARSIADEFNTQERANILWALSKLPNIDPKVIFVLTRPFAEVQPSVDAHAFRGSVALIKPQEASNILFALGQMNIRDDHVFRNLTQLILDQIDTTSAQTVANVLWAHRAVHIEPPQRLLENWAGRRLPGLVIASDPTVEYPFY